MSRTIRLAGSAAVLALLSGALPAAATPLRLTLAEHGAAMAGTSLTASWGEDAAPGDADEMELILSLDGGLTWPIRLTRDLPPGISAIGFRIPALPAVEACLGLRTGRKGMPESETLRAVSPPFEIAVPAIPATEPLARIAGEWRTPEAVDPEERPGPPVDPRTEGNGGLAPLGDLTAAALGPEAEALRPPAEGPFANASAGSPSSLDSGLRGEPPLLTSRRE